MTWSFWSHPLWLAYCEAAGQPAANCVGKWGNLILPLGDEGEMWRRISKGHRRDIKYATEAYSPADSFLIYAERHKATYPDARTNVTYGRQERMCEAGIAFPLGLGGYLECVAAALFFVADGGSYYASLARCQKHIHHGAGHLLVWRGMLEAARRGAKWMDMGPICGPDATDKERSIQAFKQHFGAVGPEVEGAWWVSSFGPGYG